MNRERAETHLRLLAEEELRRAMTRLRDGAARNQPDDAAVRSASVTGTVAGGAAPGSSLRQVPPGVPDERRARVARVARVLTVVAALDDEVAAEILADFELALATRQAGSQGRRGPGLGSWMRSPAVRRRPAMLAAAGSGAGAAAGPAHAPGSAGPQATRGRIVRLGQVIPVRGQDADGEICLMSYAQTASGPQLSLLARVRYHSGPPGRHRPGGGVPDWPQPEVPFLEQFTATDDRGTSYQMRIRDLGGGYDGWTLMLHPDPPYDPRWVDLAIIAGQPATRIDLSPSTRPPANGVTVSAATASRGEHLLHAIAARLLAATPTAPPDTRLHPAAPRPGPFPRTTDGLGDIIAALQAAGALSPLSPVPGHLAALCASLHLPGHGITASPARDLPGPWLSMITHYHRSKTRTDPARDGCAAAAFAFPDLDGIRLAILGLHTCLGDTILHMHASGPMCHVINGPDELYLRPVIWIRDNGGHWHATRTRGRSGIDGEIALRLQVVPPLSGATTWIEVLAAGQSAQARTTLPLRWQ
jgi:hypothetical protein